LVFECAVHGGDSWLVICVGHNSIPASVEDGHSIFDLVFKFCSICCRVEGCSPSILNQSPISVSMTVSKFIRRAVIIDPVETTRGRGFQ
jgi:hypothetical protein